MEAYGSYSGLKINTDKIKLVWIGKKTFSQDKIECGKDLDWGTTEFDLMEITFSVDPIKYQALTILKQTKI